MFLILRKIGWLDQLVHGHEQHNNISTIFISAYPVIWGFWIFFSSAFTIGNYITPGSKSLPQKSQLGKRHTPTQIVRPFSESIPTKPDISITCGFCREIICRDLEIWIRLNFVRGRLCSGKLHGNMKTTFHIWKSLRFISSFRLEPHWDN